MGVVLSLSKENITNHSNYLKGLILKHSWSLVVQTGLIITIPYNYQEPEYYCMISNGCFIGVPKPDNINKEYGDEFVIAEITNDNES